MSIDDCRIIQLPRLDDDRGSLSFIEGRRHVPFDITRVYYLYDMPKLVRRGGHAHKELDQVMIAMKGAFDVELDDGNQKRVFRLHTPEEGLYISHMNWRDLSDFSPGAVCLVLASDYYSEEDYFRDYDSFLAAVRMNR